MYQAENAKTNAKLGDYGVQILIRLLKIRIQK